ncbi:MAG: ATP-binding protein [Cryomorphaceae bacterium]|nr:ATP-binding protein [Cryomorphaceae bacterium]
MDNHVNHICVTGPESTGKSTLTRMLANRFSVKSASEYARVYLSGKNSYGYSDLLLIAIGQQEVISQVQSEAKDLFFSDTDLLTIVIWSKYRYGKVDVNVHRMWKENLPNKYLLCAVDIPWEDDPLREHPQKRDEIFQIYEKLIKSSGVPYELVKGDRQVFAENYCK